MVIKITHSDKETFNMYFVLVFLAMQYLFCISYSANVYAVLNTCVLIKPEFTERKTELCCVLFKPSKYSKSNYIRCSYFENVIPFYNFNNDLFILEERHQIELLPVFSLIHICMYTLINCDIIKCISNLNLAA